MRDRHASAVLVLHDDGHLLGIFTGRDAICRVLAAGENTAVATLADVMTPNPTTISRYSTAIEALRLMWDGGFRHLPVIDKGKLIGLVKRRDFKSEDLADSKRSADFGSTSDSNRMCARTLEAERRKGYKFIAAAFEIDQDVVAHDIL
jgi:CBS-domain-containing membrane protein